MSIKNKKEELIKFIAWKMSHGSETKDEAEEIMRKCRKMSYKELHAYAVQHDFIDN